MITLITGTPGAGKTLYTVANLLRDLVGSEVDSTDDNGQPCKIRRTVYTNINLFPAVGLHKTAVKLDWKPVSADLECSSNG